MNKWQSLAFLCGIFFVYTVDRALLGLLAIPIQNETGVSDLQFGILNSVVFWTYALAVPFAGLVGDRHDKRMVICMAVLAWSVMTVLAGFARGFWSLLALVSVAITLPQTFYGPSANALVAKEHVGTRAVALSIHQAAYYIGWFASGGVAAAALSIFGSWRGAYFSFGVFGLAIGLAFLLRTRKRIGDGSGEMPGNRTAASGVARSFRAFFCCPSALLAASGYVAMVFAAFGYTAWGPKFVAVKFGVSPAVAGTGVMFWHFAAAFASILVAGTIADRFVRRWPRFRLALQVSALVAATPVLAVFGMASALPAVWAAAAVYGLLRGTFESCQYASLFDVIPPDCRAGAVGFLNVVAGLVGSLAPILIGWLSERFGVRGMEVGFAALGGSLAMAALLMLVSLLFTFNRDRIKEVLHD